MTDVPFLANTTYGVGGRGWHEVCKWPRVFMSIMPGNSKGGVDARQQMLLAQGIETFKTSSAMSKPTSPLNQTHQSCQARQNPTLSRRPPAQTSPPPTSSMRTNEPALQQNTRVQIIVALRSLLSLTSVRALASLQTFASAYQMLLPCRTCSRKSIPY